MLKLTYEPWADPLWFGALLITGVPVTWKTLHGMFAGHFASDVVAMLAIVTAIVLRQPVSGLVIVLMQTGGELLERYAEGRASRAVRELEEAAPRVGHRWCRRHRRRRDRSGRRTPRAPGRNAPG
jgi:cation transport ATPase